MQFMKPIDTRTDLFVEFDNIKFLFEVRDEWLALFQVKLGCVRVANHSKGQFGFESWADLEGRTQNIQSCFMNNILNYTIPSLPKDSTLGHKLLGDQRLLVDLPEAPLSQFDSLTDIPVNMKNS